MSAFVPCPNGGRCGVPTHDPAKGEYAKCAQDAASPVSGSGKRAAQVAPALGSARAAVSHQSDAPLEHHSLQTHGKRAIDIATLALDGDLDVAPPYQRSSVWTNEQRMGLIKSWVQGIPVPSIMVNNRMERDWSQRSGPLKDGDAFYGLIDGKQRVETSMLWLSGELAVPASWFPEEHIEDIEETDDGPYVRHSGLTIGGQRRFANRAQLPMVEAQLGTLQEEADMYLLVNGGGTAQTDDDMANAAQYASGPRP